MREHVYKIDENGFWMETHLAYLDENDNIIDEDKQGFVTVDYPSGLIKKKWTGIEWVEGESQEEKDEREAQQLIESLKPSPSEVENADMEIKIITLLTELEVI